MSRKPPRPQIIEAAQKVLKTMRFIAPHFAHGVTQNDIVKGLGMDASAVHRCVNTLKAEGFVEEIPETGRLRASVQFARWGIAQMDSLDAAQSRLIAVRTRIAPQL